MFSDSGPQGAVLELGQESMQGGDGGRDDRQVHDGPVHVRGSMGFKHMGMLYGLGYLLADHG